MAETQLYYIGTSKAVEIKGGISISKWGYSKDSSLNKNAKWTKLKKPVAKSNKKVKYSGKLKTKAGSSSKELTTSGTVRGTSIINSKTITYQGTSVKIKVTHKLRGYTIYTKTKALKKANKMGRTIYDNSDYPYQYHYYYYDTPIYTSNYSDYDNILNQQLVFFSDKYYDTTGAEVTTKGHLPHPTSCELTYSDVHKNVTSNYNNSSDSRDNQGSYILSNVRANVRSISLTWEGLTAVEGADLLSVLNPTKKYPYINVQFLDYQTNSVANGTFFVGDRKIKKLHNGMFESISVDLTEV